MPRIRGYLPLYLSATIFAFVSLAVKLASARYGGLFVSASRFAIGAVLGLAILLVRYGGIHPKNPRLLALRGLYGAVSMISSYAAISLSGPGRAIVLSNTYPLFVALFGALFFGERLRPRTLWSIAICIAGAALVARDGSGASLAGDLLALLSSVTAGFAVNYVRRAAAHDDPVMIYLSPCILGLPLFFFAHPAEAAGTAGIAGPLLLLAVGGGALLAQALMARGYRQVSAGAGSVVFYWETALTVILGILFAGETLTPRFAAGLALIFAGLRFNQAPVPKSTEASGT
jgi:S-adenosylmethionine uptake transporter